MQRIGHLEYTGGQLHGAATQHGQAIHGTLDLHVRETRDVTVLTTNAQAASLHSEHLR
jgi:hypothetical protein